MVMVIYLFLIKEYYFELGLNAKTLAMALHRDAQADARGATQVLDHGGHAVARCSCLPQELDRGAEAFARGAVPSAPQGT
jgi:hypothetical protein